MRIKIWAAIVIPVLCACQAERAAENRTSAAAEEIESAAAPVGNILWAPDATADTRSRFTSIDPDKCRLIEQNLEEGGWWRRLCEGAAGYKLELSESDLRQDIEVIPADGRRSELGLSDIVANGAFNSLGKTAEWRGADPARPEALIVRLGVASDPEGKKPDVSNLVVVRLKAPACIVAVVPPGSGQNEAARKIADGELPACRKR
jgi:hypothetical protein